MWPIGVESGAKMRTPLNPSPPPAQPHDRLPVLVDPQPVRGAVAAVDERALLAQRTVAYAVRDGCWASSARSSTAAYGTPDGLRIDEDGNLWCGWGGGEGLGRVRVFAPDSTPIGHIDLPERCANLAFGGRARDRCSGRPQLSVRSLR